VPAAMAWEKGISWWKEKDYFWHDYLLISYMYGKQLTNKGATLRELLSIPKQTKLFLDSGGFSIMTKNLSYSDYTWEKVLEWQEAQDADYAFTLDIPPYVGDYNLSVAQIPKEKMQMRMENSVKYSLQMLRHKKDDLKLLFVTHGKQWEDISYYMDLIERNKDGVVFDGFAVSPKPAIDIVGLITQTFQIRERFGEQLIHILGVSGFNTIPICVYLNVFSFDSISYIMGNKTREYRLPIDLKMKLYFGESKQSNIKELPCTCPVCRKHTVSDMIHDKSQSGFRISLHNLYWILYFTRVCNKLRNDTELFRTFVKRNCSPKVLIYLDFIDYAKENGIEKAYKKFVLNNKTSDLSSYI
jgi:tRNA-guanine family transglycosylase